MAIILEAAYSKKLGLPNYSSHSYVVSIRTELSDANQVAEESKRLYALLQRSVDDEIQKVGFLPDATSYGMNGAEAQPQPQPASNGNAHSASHTNGDAWKCSDKQKDLILKLVDEHHLEKKQVEALAQEMFNIPVKALNRLQASGLIEELLERHGKATRKNGHGPANGVAAYRRHTARA